MDQEQLRRCRAAFEVEYGERPDPVRWPKYCPWWDAHYELWQAAWAACLSAGGLNAAAAPDSKEQNSIR